MVVEAFTYSKETGKKYSGAVKISEEAYNAISSELLKEDFFFSEGDNKLRASIVAIRSDNIENFRENSKFSEYINNLLIVC